MNKNLKTLCAAVAIALLPIGATCYAQTNVEERYETIWMEAEQKVEEKETKETFANCSLDEMVKLKEDKAKYESSIGKEVTIKIKVTKITVEGDKTHIVTKTGPLQKMKCTVDNTAKTDMSKYKAGDEVVVKGTLKDIKGKTVILDNSTIIKDMGPSGEYNKDKYKNNTQEKKPDTKVEDNKKEENKKPDIKAEENKKPDVKVEDNKKEENKKPDTKVEDKNKQEIKKVDPSTENNKKENAPSENENKCKKHEEKNKCKKPENKVEIKKPQENKKENCPREQE